MPRLSVRFRLVFSSQLLRHQLLTLVSVTEKILARDPLEELRRAFSLFDDDKSGRISLRNLRRVAKELGEQIGDEEL